MPRLEVEISEALERFLAHQEEAGHARADLVTLALANYARQHNLTHILHPAKREASEPLARAKAVAASATVPVVRRAVIDSVRVHSSGALIVTGGPGVEIVIPIGDVMPIDSVARYIDVEGVTETKHLVGREIAYDANPNNKFLTFFKPIERSVG